MLPKITIITAVYNGVNTIEQTISSIVNQTYPNLEYVIIDGGSNDGTIDIIKKYEQKISYWISEKDNGIYDAWNKGVDAATGSHIQFLGADDCLCSYDTIEKIAKEIDDDTDLLSCPIYTVDEKDCNELIIDNKRRAEYSGAVPPTSGLFVRRELCKRYPFDVRYKIAGDYKFLLSCCHDDTVKIKYTDIPVTYFSLGGVSSVQEELTTKESIEIANQFGVKFPPEKNNEYLAEKGIKVLKKSLKESLRYFHILSWIQNKKTSIQKGMYWKKHHCNNKICRWCKRNTDMQ